MTTMSLFRKIFHLSHRFSPTLANLIHGFYVTVNGSRFDEVKRYIDSSLSKPIYASSGDSLSRSIANILEEVDHNPRKVRYAFVSNFPPEDTGIATCSFYSWLGQGDPIDIFCPVRDIDWFVRNREILAKNYGSGVRLLDIGTFLSADCIHKYEKIILATGNSDHCLFVHEIIKKANISGGTNRCVLYVHDPCLLNLIQKGAELSGAELLGVLEKIYRRPLKGALSGSARDWEIHAYLISQGVFGTRWFYNQGIRHFLVNSEAASKLLHDDLAGTGVKIQTVFHPAFLPLGAQPYSVEAASKIVPGINRPLIIGSFGIPSDSKKTIDIIQAAIKLRDRPLNVKLILAGYQVKSFVKKYAEDLKNIECEFFDGPTELQLVDCMRQVDVAVQLRSQNLGESSGIVPQLLMLRKSTIVSAVGSFVEFGDAVISIKSDASVSILADAILQASLTPPQEERMEAYVAARTPAKFRQELFRLLDEME